MMNNTPDRHFYNVLIGQMEGFFFFASVIRFLRNGPLPSKTVHASQIFASVKLQQPTIMAPSGPALSILQYIGNYTSSDP